MLELIFANFVLASTFTLTKVLLDYVPPLYLAGFRCLGTAIVSLIISKRSARKITVLSSTMIKLLVSIAFFGIFMVYFLEFWALQSVTTTKVAVLYNVFPFFVVIFSFFFFSEQMNLYKWIGLLIGIVGIVPVLTVPAPVEEKFILWWHISWQELALLIAMVCESFSWVCSRILIRRYHFSAFLLNGISLLCGGMLLLFFAICVEQLPRFDNPGYILLLLCCLFSTAVISNNWITSLFKKFSLSLISLGGLLLPVFTALLGYIFLGETITKETLLSLFIIAIGMYIFYKEELKQDYRVL